MSLDPTSVRTENNDDAQIQIAGGVTTGNLAEVNGSNELLVEVGTFSDTPLSTNLAEVGGTTQSGVDIANKIEELADALQNAFAGDDQLRIDIENWNATQTVTVTDDGSFTATVEQSTHDNLNTNANLQVADTDVSSTNPVPVTDAGDVGTPVADYQATAALAAQASETLTFAITSGLSGRLQEVFASAEVPFTAEVQKFDGGAATTIAFLNGEAGDSETFTPEDSAAPLFEQNNSGGSSEFRVLCTNNNASGIGDSGAVHVTFETSEV